MAQTERKKGKTVAGRLSNTEKEEDSSRRKAKDRKMKSAPGGLAQRKMKKTVPDGSAKNKERENLLHAEGQRQRKRKTPYRRTRNSKTETFPDGRAKNTENERLVRVEEPKPETAGDCSSCKDQREKNKKTVTRRKIQTFLFKAYVELSQRNITRQSVRHIRLPKRKRRRRRKSTLCRSNFTAVGWNSCLIWVLSVAPCVWLERS